MKRHAWFFLCLTLVLCGCSRSPKEAAAPAEDANALYQQGRFAEAALAAERALKDAERAVGRDDKRLAVPLNNLAGLYRIVGRLDESEKTYNRLLQIREAGNPEDPELYKTLHDLATVNLGLRRYPEAEALEKRVMEYAERTMQPGDPRFASTLNNMGYLLLMQGKAAEAETHLKKALGALEASVGDGHEHTQVTLGHLAELYRSQKRYPETEDMLKRLLAGLEKANGPDHIEVARILNNLALVYKEQGKNDEAAPLYTRSVGILEKNLQAGSRDDLAVTLENYALLLLRADKKAEAQKMAERARKVRSAAASASGSLSSSDASPDRQ